MGVEDLGKFIWQELRPHQWTKNLLVFAGLLFGGNFFVEEQLIMAIKAFLAFCMASSGVYIINDVADVEKDRANPNKCFRPIAAGYISISTAYVCMILLFVGGQHFLIVLMKIVYTYS